MRRSFAMLAALPLLAVAPPAAHAAGGVVQVETTAIAKPLGTGYLVIAVCEATAVPNATTDDPDAPLSTTVFCEVNGVTATQSAPGGKAVTAVVTATATPIQACHAGSATFLDASPAGTYTDTKVRACSPIGPA